jgi:hypothetical protein
MKAILILNPLEMILNISNHLDPPPIILLHWQGLSKYRHILIVQKGKGKFSFAETSTDAMRSPSLDLEVVIIGLVDIFERFCLVIDDNVFHVVCYAKMPICSYCFLMVVRNLDKKTLMNSFNDQWNTLSIRLNPTQSFTIDRHRKMPHLQ